jgi:hypothetical protein
MVAGPETHALMPPMPPGHSTKPRRWPWVLGCGTLGCGCLVVALLVAGGLGLLGVTAFNDVAGCVPSDFPSYPGTFWVGTNGVPGDCIDGHASFDDSAKILDFYASRLAEGRWRTIAIDRAIERIDFAHTAGASIGGSLWLVDGPFFRTICTEFMPLTPSPAGEVRPTVQLMALHTVQRGTICGGKIPHSQ